MLTTSTQQWWQWWICCSDVNMDDFTFSFFFVQSVFVCLFDQLRRVCTFVSPQIDRSNNWTLYWHNAHSKFHSSLFILRVNCVSLQQNFAEKKIVVNFCFWSEQRVRVGKKATFYQTTSQIAWVHVTLFQWTWAWHELQLRAIASTHAIRSWNNAKLLLLHTMILIEWVFSFFLSFFLLRRAHKNSLFLLPSWILCESLTSRQNMKKNS